MNPPALTPERHLSFRVVLLLFMMTLGVNGQMHNGTKLVVAKLVSDTTSVTPGKPFTVGLLLKMQPGWHMYWRYPGDSGLPTKIVWHLPEGFTAGALQWPLPTRQDDEGDLQTYVYNDEVMLLTEITPPAQTTQKELTLGASASWLVCDKSCVPGKAELSLPMHVGGGEASSDAELFKKYRDLLPRSGDMPFTAAWSGTAGQVALQIKGASGSVDLLPLPKAGTFVDHPKRDVSGDSVTFTVPVHSGDASKTPSLDAIIVTQSPEGARHGWFIQQPPATGATLPASSGTAGSGLNNSASKRSTPQRSGGLLKFLAFGFIGGFILNLMPCVLPVIALKIFGFIKQAGEAPGKVFRLGLAFIAGIFAWFIGLAALLSLFKLAGRELNWSAQFQNPYCLVAMCAILLVFALNLFGVFEVFLPQTVGNKAMDLAGREGYAGAFFHGMFATLLATPCTAPFLGPALGFAFAPRAAIPVVFAIFIAVAAGMSFPYFLLTVRPSWMRFLPRPGVWMVRFKQFTGFMLIGTLLWLLMVLGLETSVQAMISAAAFLLCLGVACWIKGAFLTAQASNTTRFISIGSMGGVVIFSLLFFVDGRITADGAAQSHQQSAGWLSFSPARLDESIKSGNPVFVDFTADWCANCKYNERFVLGSSAVRQAFKSAGVILLKADWTRGDPEITKLLRKFGRAGVPVYAMYPAGGGEPDILSELLTQQEVLDGIEKARKIRAG